MKKTGSNIIQPSEQIKEVPKRHFFNLLREKVICITFVVGSEDLEYIYEDVII
jgi:hypothetical protein